MNNTETSLKVTVDAQLETIEARIQDNRADVVAAIAPLNETQRNGLVADAWSIGLRAILNAHRQAEESRLVDVSKALKEDLDKQLSTYIERQQSDFVQALARYFDPRDGQVMMRLDNFVRDEGELARTMERFLAPEHGVLAQTLAREIGETSPLLRRLSPTDNEGILCLLESKLRETLAANQAEVTRALDPLAKDGAIARFLRALREDLRAAETDRSKQLELATRALDPSNDNSLLNRLVREATQARSEVVSAMNPDIPHSPMAVLKNALSTMLERHGDAQRKAMETMVLRQEKLEQEIRESLARLEERKRRTARSTQGGLAFQDDVLRFVQAAVNGAPVTVDMTANTVGAKAGCKVGDQVVRFTQESKYEGSAMVIEAKRDSAYTVTKALQELEIARGNRLANGAIFVMARSHAPTAFPTFARFGNDIIVVWDESDGSTDPYLHAAIMLGLALASRQQRPQDAGDIQALADIEHRIQKELERHETMRKLCESIRKDADKLAEEVRKGKDAIDLLLRKAKSALKALNVELAEANDAQHEPVVFPPSSLLQGQGAINRAVGENQALQVRRSA